MSTSKTFFQSKSVLAALLAILLVAVLFTVSLGQQNVSAAGTGPCDIYGNAGTPCVAAHSTVRALYGSYNGRLYQVKRASNGQTTDISTLSAGGIANAAAQDSFCSGTTCTITIIYDQSGKGNDLTPAPAGGAKNTADNPANATALPITINGQKAYGVQIDSGIGYRRDSTSGIATGDAAETEYMVTSSTHVNGGCCFDYGNAETNNDDDGAGTMEAVFFGTINIWTHGTGSGPWVMADLENGLFGCSAAPNGSTCSNDPTVTGSFITAMVKGHSGGTFGLKEGNAQSGGLTTVYSGARPSGYSPMKKQGAIILGIGGDNSNSSTGYFFEGVIVTGDPTDATDSAVQANIVAAGYGSNGSGPTPTPPPSGNLLTNGNMESGTTGWSVFGSGTLTSVTSPVHSGSRALEITGRTASWNGPSQSLTSKLTNGKSYTTIVWMRSVTNSPTGKVTMAVTANGTTNYIQLASGAVNSSGWTELTGTTTVSWSGTLSSATFYVETTSGTDSFYIDDASMQ